MTIFYILFALTIIAGLVFVFRLSQIHQNPKIPHKTTPAKYEIPFQEIRFTTKNGCQLYGWWMPCQNKASNSVPTLILVHGWGRNLESMMPYIKELHLNGCNLLAFDSRNHGSSDSDKHSNMLKFAEDIHEAVTFVEKQVGVDPNRIGVIGLSMGGAALIYAAAHDTRIKSAITVGALAHPVDHLRLEFRKKRIPYFPLVWLIVKFIQFQIRASIDQIAPVNNIQDTIAKFLLIHGEKDAVVPVEQGEKLKNAGNPETVQLWVVPEKGHSNCCDYPEFWIKVHSFLQKSLSA